MNAEGWKKKHGMPVRKKRLLIRVHRPWICLRCLEKPAIAGKKRCADCVQYKTERRKKMRHDSA